jgi:hypothetical protein
MMAGPTYEAVRLALPGLDVRPAGAGATVRLCAEWSVQIEIGSLGRAYVYAYLIEAPSACQSRDEGHNHAGLVVAAATVAEVIRDLIEAVDRRAQMHDDDWSALLGSAAVAEARAISARGVASALRAGMEAKR